MALPRRVQRELEAAEAQEQAFITARTDHTAPAVQSLAAVEVATPPVVAPEPPQAVTPPAPPPPEPPKVDFEHKYRVLQGMYEADVTRVKAAQARMDAEIAELKRARETPPQPAQLDPNDVDKFGADLIEMVNRHIERERATVNSRLDELERKVGSVARTTAERSKQSFFERLKAAVPDYEVVNADEGWLEWLGVVDDLYGIPRQQALDDAVSKQDVTRTAALFRAYKTSKPAPLVPESLEQQLVPSGVGTPPAPPQRAPVYIAEKAITDFYNEVGRGQWKGREEEMNRLEEIINLAVAEGRVR